MGTYGYLERQVQAPLSLRQIDPLIRQLELYRDVIQAKTKENESRTSSNWKVPYGNSGSAVWLRRWKQDCARFGPNPWRRWT
jgi:hypothetical protein